MKYFYDFEFIENGETIDVISIGMVCEDGRQFYAQNLNCDFSKANDWVKENVLPHLTQFDMNSLRPIIDTGVEGGYGDWRSIGSIAAKLSSPMAAAGLLEPWQRHSIEFVDSHDEDIEFWGYYSAYDHVALGQLFGRMIDLPRGWPKYTRDIKQLCDSLGNPRLPELGKGEHNALADARWNEQAYSFLVQLGTISTKKAMDTLRAALQGDWDYAWGWHCNIAMVSVDQGMEPSAANRAAAQFMKNCFDIDVMQSPQWRDLKIT